MLGIGSAILGGGALATRGVIDSLPQLRELIGYTPEKIAEKETFDLNKPEKYKDDIGDWARYLATGVSLDKVKEAAKQQAIQNVNDTLRPDIIQIKQGYKDLNLENQIPLNLGYKDGLGGTKGESPQATALRVKKELDKLKSLQNIKANYPDLPIGGLIGKSSYEIDAAGTKHGKTLFDSPEATTKRAEERSDSRYIDTLEAQLAERQLQRTQAQNNFQLQMGQAGLNNRRYDLEAARSERRDKREMLAVLLQGLGNVQNNLVNY
jgi:hypothetical protein